MKRLKELRNKLSLTQEIVSRELNINRPTYARYESGERQPDFETLIKMSKYFNVTIDYLLENENVNQPTNDENNNLSPKEKLLIENYKQLNEEGKEKLISYSDDLVSSGKYIKSLVVTMDKEA